ncbi:diguanylate cyclase [Telmatospirillum sp. J64-1]|uniref:GGDEF domain-containing protein n=1 Tax=Telmatospirillum sp. J64-1 TaxID=2502183 RepID=UPI00115CC6DE|nr:GGDEF domain-containing protein [Telmatospirillum sp. J64-1]
MEWAEDYHERAWRTARRALAIMLRLELSPTPRNFALFCAYVGGSDAALVKAVDQAMAMPGGLTDTACAKLHQAHLHGLEAEELRTASARMEKALRQAFAAIGTASDGAGRYGRALSRFTGGLSQREEDLPDLAPLLEESEEMVQANRALQEQLVASSAEILRLRQDMDALRREAATDPLTGIANRRSFDEAMGSAIRQENAAPGGLSLLMVDIDHFKAFNDSWGHQMGDQVLKLVARVLVDCIREGDLPARFGGEEFAVLLPGARLSQAVEIAEAIRSAVAEKKVINRRTGQDLGQVSLSVGVAEYRPDETAEQLIERADRVLYLAKRDGRNRVMADTADLAAAGS